MSLVQFYLESLRRRPLATKAISAAVLSGLSSILAQKLKSTKPLNLKAIKDQVLIGLFLRGPYAHYWFDFLNKVLFGKVKSNGLGVLLAKVLVDQSVYAPTFCSLQMVAFKLAEGVTDAGTILNSVSSNLWTVLKANWKVWPLVTLINFYFVPLELRVLFANVVALFWTAYLILATQSRPKKE